MRKFLRGVVIVLLALAILQMADWVLLCDNRPPIFACLIVIGLIWLSWKSASKASLREIPKDFDSEGGIDWQEKSVNGQVYLRSGPWVLIVFITCTVGFACGFMTFDATRLGDTEIPVGVRIEINQAKE